MAAWSSDMPERAKAAAGGRLVARRGRGILHAGAVLGRLRWPQRWQWQGRWDVERGGGRDGGGIVLPHHRSGAELGHGGVEEIGHASAAAATPFPFPFPRPPRNAASIILLGVSHRLLPPTPSPSSRW
uniref:Uncharacterized protein n=1 Tax=Oryza nivara TaxID=4536 RepID=A0A0E0G9W9_ORYNI